jgi:hypothetical protein
MKKISACIGGIIIVAVFISGFAAYFITYQAPGTRQWLDGWGRPLSESPLVMRLLFGQDRLWAGWFWFFVDSLIFFGGLILGWSLVSFGLKREKVTFGASGRLSGR